MLKSFLICFVSAYFCLFGSASLAQDQSLDLYKPQAALLSVMFYFELYETNRGDSRYWQPLIQSAQKFSNSLTGQDDLKPVRKHWAVAAKHLNSAAVSIKRGGFLEQEKQKQYYLKMDNVWQQLQQFEAENKIIKSEVERLHLLILQLSLRYLNPRYALAGSYQEWNLSTMADAVDKGLKQLNLAAPSDSLDDLLKQWHLLNRFFHDSNNAVPFMVTRFAEASSAELSRRLEQQP